jgi:hypothetical protein
MQDKMTIAFYSQKLNTAQKLSYIETYKEEKNILLCFHQPIIILRDYKNNIFNGLKDLDCILRKYWCLLIEEYGVTFECFPGKKNISLRFQVLNLMEGHHPLNPHLWLSILEDSKLSGVLGGWIVWIHEELQLDPLRVICIRPIHIVHLLHLGNKGGGFLRTEGGTVAEDLE